MSLEEKYGVTIAGIGFDRYNCLSSAQKWENAGYTTIEVVQHSKVLHLPTKTLEESIINGTFCYEENQIYEINFQNARCQKDTNLNKYVSKKKSNGKVDMVVSTIIAMSLLVETVILGGGEWGVQI
jgi:phage terminase large subunit-like protein